MIQDSFELDPYGDSIFLFSGWSKDRYKCLYFDGDGFAMLYKRLDNGKLQWPKDENEVRNLSQQELRWLLEGLSIQQPKAIHFKNHRLNVVKHHSLPFNGILQVLAYLPKCCMINLHNTYHITVR